MTKGLTALFPLEKNVARAFRKRRGINTGLFESKSL